MNSKIISIVSIVVAGLSLCISVWTMQSAKQEYADSLSIENTHAKATSMEWLAGEGRSAASVRISGDINHGFKCSANLLKGGSIQGSGPNATEACLDMLSPIKK